MTQEDMSQESTPQESTPRERTVRSQVQVAVDPATAFTAFTEEIDLWWVRGPINFLSDAGRVVQVRCEPGVGGRIVEVLDDPVTGEVMEKASITAWEPGARLAWSSPHDDVTTEVRFTAAPGGTLVTVEHRIPFGGNDFGGTSWSRVVPRWFGSWCARRDHDAHELLDIARVALGVHYARPAAAAHWLADTFGFEPTGDLPQGPDPLSGGDHPHPWIEFRIGNSSLYVFPLDAGQSDDAGSGAGEPAFLPWVYVDDLAAHFERAKSGGASIVAGIHSFASAIDTYTADDPEGNRWTFLQARPTMR
jgi:uncharacterized glyoxalase superfamily protein PhnB